MEVCFFFKQASVDRLKTEKTSLGYARSYENISEALFQIVHSDFT